MKTTLTLHMFGQTDVGLSREHNEDCIGWDDKGLVVLADGMGGHNAGEVASKLAVDAITEALNTSIFNQKKVDELVEPVTAAVSDANRVIFEHASTHIQCAGMGTTVVMGLFIGDTCTLAHVGDSRIYRLRDTKLEQLTSDHSLLQEMINEGHMTREEADDVVNKNLITRALGIAPEVEVDVQQQVLQDGDIYLLCSDGLTDLVTDEGISICINESITDIEHATNALVGLANSRGGSDNISVILVKVGAAK